MLPLMLAAVLSVAPKQGLRQAEGCIRRVCTDECWRVRLTYRQITSTPEDPPAYAVAQAFHGGVWGDQAGAKCHADELSRDGFWLDSVDGLDRVPTVGPTKIPSGSIELLQVLEAPF